MNDLAYGFSAYRFRSTGVPVPRLVKRIALAPGDAGVEQTIHEMVGMVRDSTADPRWGDLAVRLVPAGPALLGPGAYRQVLGGLRHTFRYKRDAAGAEQVWRPDVHIGRFASLGYSWGDCDDAAVVAASVVRAINLGPVRFRTIANGRRGRELNHVFAEVLMDGRWLTLDFLSPGQPEIRSRVWPIS